MADITEFPIPTEVHDHPTGLVLPTHVQFAGPVPGTGIVLVNNIGFIYDHPNYTFLTAVTSNTKQFKFSLNYPPVVYAIWQIIWKSPDSTLEAQLTHADGGPTNVTQIGSAVANDGSNEPRIGFGIITTEINALITAGADKYLGFRVRNTTTTSWTLYECRLELHWQL